VRPAAQPLAGVRVLEFAHLFPGPYAGLVLACLGADVVKVEPPSGDPTRDVPPFVDHAGGAGAVFCALNRDKRSVQLDLATDEATETYLAIAEHADVVLDGYRPGVADRLGVGFDTLAEDRQHLVYVHLSGFGSTGELADEPGHDVTYQAWAGTLDDEPRLPNLPAADATGALWATTLALAHLDAEGCHELEPSLTGALQAPALIQDAIQVAGGQADRLTGGHPGYEVYACREGAHLALGALEPPFWEALCTALEAPEIQTLGHPVDPEDPEGARQRLADRFRQRSREDWLDQLRESPVPCAPVRSTDQALEEPLELSSLDPPGVDDEEDLRGAPALGEHTDDVLAEIEP
jgi:crotonobetainyl-CoA:carnitine CoA-transferase CaiB-like acyl-CoA transferase